MIFKYSLFSTKHYIGKIIVPANKDEPMIVVDGVHEAIISKELFFRVQAILADGIKKGNKVAKTKARRDELPLRGFLLCNNCGGTVTGSRSKGRLGKRYYYYHCNHCRKERHPAHVINDSFEELLSLFQVDEAIKSVYDLIMEKLLLTSNGDSKIEAKKLKSKIQDTKKRLESIQDLLVDGTIAPDDYKSMRNRYQSNLLDLQEKLSGIKLTKSKFEEYLLSGLSFMQNLCNSYKKNSTVAMKQKIIGSIFPEKLTFDETHCRTPKINQAVLLIFSVCGGR